MSGWGVVKGKVSGSKSKRTTRESTNHSRMPALWSQEFQVALRHTKVSCWEWWVTSSLDGLVATGCFPGLQEVHPPLAPP